MTGICCPRCERPVYYGERKCAFGSVWHSFCFSCYRCRKLLDTSTAIALTSGDKCELYCRECYQICYGSCAQSKSTPVYTGRNLNKCCCTPKSREHTPPQCKANKCFCAPKIRECAPPQSITRACRRSLRNAVHGCRPCTPTNYKPNTPQRRARTPTSCPPRQPFQQYTPTRYRQRTPQRYRPCTPPRCRPCTPPCYRPSTPPRWRSSTPPKYRPYTPPRCQPQTPPCSPSSPSYRPCTPPCCAPYGSNTPPSYSLRSRNPSHITSRKPGDPCTPPSRSYSPMGSKPRSSTPFRNKQSSYSPKYFPTTNYACTPCPSKPSIDPCLKIYGPKFCASKSQTNFDYSPTKPETPKSSLSRLLCCSRQVLCSPCECEPCARPNSSPRNQSFDPYDYCVPKTKSCPPIDCKPSFMSSAVKSKGPPEECGCMCCRKPSNTCKCKCCVPVKTCESRYGGGYLCARCKELVYHAEMVLAAHSAFHNSCFSCYMCRKPLDSSNYCEYCGEIYCKQCYNKYYGPIGYGYGSLPTLQSTF